MKTPLPPSWHILQWPPSCRMNAFWALDSMCLFLPPWHSGWRRMLKRLFRPSSTTARQPLTIPSHQGNVLSDLSPGPLRIYRRKAKIYTRNTYLTDFAWFIRISQMNKTYFHHAIVVVLLLSHVWLFVISWTAAHQDSLSFTIFQSLFKLMSIESMMLSNRLILCHPVILLPLIFPSIRVFSNESALCIRWLKYWSFSLSSSPSREYSGLISFSIDWFDLLSV